MRIAFITPYLDTLGGGEKYLLDISRVLHDLGHTCVFFWPENLSERIADRFGNAYGFVKFDPRWHTFRGIRKILYTRQFDRLFYITDGSYFISLAKKNYVLLQVPQQNLLPHNRLSLIKARLFTPFVFSNFVKRYFVRQNIWQEPAVIYPLIEVPENTALKKEKIILSVGRFFGHLHSKRQDVLIKAFRYARDQYPEYKEYRLILAGSYQEADKKYLEKVKKMAEGRPDIQFALNIGRPEMESYYQKAAIYWHAAGYGEEERRSPEKMEHFGIAVAEAMGRECVPVVYRAGGPKEIIMDGHSGYLFEKRIELIKKTLRLMKDPALMRRIGRGSRQRVKEKFSGAQFSKKIASLVQ